MVTMQSLYTVGLCFPEMHCTIIGLVNGAQRYAASCTLFLVFDELLVDIISCSAPFSF